ncbi:AMP-binding protein [Gemmatimonas groenlandica]|uniref:acetate--CoA ligase n=1 Tax=Gemmatimonas groenlandica TaxID=2732249 RepID=A0A6M4IN93_9BACT|nr:AMP-binding protein [Gemmatimonas groenlandica]QJR34927.1 AMP-binding protein [Gemmatimonas groenlandica]
MSTLPSVAPPIAECNPVRSRADWQRMYDASRADPGAFHGDIAAQQLHWFDPARRAWLTCAADGTWNGYDASTGEPVASDAPRSYRPWSLAFDDREPPFYRWFVGARTNACFNEVDRHVLSGHGDETAFLVEGDRWDQSRDHGRGAPVVAWPWTRRALLVDVARCAIALRQLGLTTGDRIALNLPNIPEQIAWTEAAKRLGIVYTPVFGGFSDKTLADRVFDAGARVVITADGGYRNAQIVPFKAAFTDPALERYIPVARALDAVRVALESIGLSAGDRSRVVDAAEAAVQGEITVERSDIMRGVGRALSTLTESSSLSATEASRVRTTLAQALVEVGADVTTVIVVRHTGQADVPWREGRDVWAHDLLAKADAELVAGAARAGVQVDSGAALAKVADLDCIRAVWEAVPPVPVDAEFPLFFIYTSGSTGKPKGVVHVHGGYVAGVAYTMRVAFDARPGDVMYVVADPGWITGQSYMISAALTTRVTSVLAEGAPVFPSAGRFASIIERYGVTIFKAGVTFLKAVMTDPQNVEDVRRYDLSSLRVSTFCAEPVSPAVQAFGMQLMCPWYINSYWATEHGGLVWTHFFGNADFPLRADAHTYPLPWIQGDVWVADGDADSRGQAVPRSAADGERGEIVIEQPYPYLARTIWGDAAGFVVRDGSVAPTWRGDAARYQQTYWSRWRDRWAYTQGDVAIRHADGSFSLHGRSDDVINVSGHRMGTEEIEGAILRDKQMHAHSPVGNVLVIGAPHREKGLTPLAFIVPAPGRRLTLDDRRRLTEIVRQEKGAVAVPEEFLEIPAFPETRSGKYVRRMVRALVDEQPLGDTSTLRNPEVIPEIARVIEAWRARQRISEGQRILSLWRYFRVQYYDVSDSARIAVVTVTNAPVNALNERALDELCTVVEHLRRQDEVRAVVFTGSGTSSFVAGADVRQLLDEVETIEDALPLPNVAHLAFRMIEQMPKPCIAAINGVALGGGLEFALACHYRVAEPTAVFGQPEIRLNLLPGYGGTQRLTRLLADRDGNEGFITAMEIIGGGRQFSAADGLAWGVVDEVVDGATDVVSRATALARAFITDGSSVLARRMPSIAARRLAWENPGHLDVDALLALPPIARLAEQSQHAGRGPAIARVFDAVRCGWRDGLIAGLAREARLFAEAVVDPDGGKRGIQAFFDKRSAPLPTRRRRTFDADEQAAAIAQGELLPVGAPFYPGFTSIPAWQYGHGVIRDEQTGAPAHGLPRDAERELVVPVDLPGANDALVYVLASEVNFNDIWAITGIPVSPFDNHDQDWQVTGSGGVGLVVALGAESKREGRLRVGDLVSIYSGQSELLSPFAARDPMSADFRIQGYESRTGSHQQFLTVQAPQLHPVPTDLTLEAAGSYVLNLGTVVRALFTTLRIERGRTMFVEGAATGTGLEALKSAVRHGCAVTGMVSTSDRADTILASGARGSINRRDAALQSCFTPVPDSATEISEWEQDGEPLLNAFRAQHDGRLADYVVSHAGELSFPRSFQLLAEGGALTFYGASSGYHFTFVGKSGAEPPSRMLERAALRAGEAVLVYYGVGDASTSLIDDAGLEAIEAAISAGARVCVATSTEAQREFVQSLGFGDGLRGILAIETLARRGVGDFAWPRTMPPLPDVRRDGAAFRESVRAFQEQTLKPFGTAVGKILRSADNPRGAPALIVERAGHDALAVSTSLVQPFTGRVVYFESMQGRRYSFYAPQVWTRQRRILLPTASILGTHLCNAYEVVRMNELVDAGLLDVTAPTMVPWNDLAQAHQAMWDNQHAGATYVVNHALPMTGLRSADQLFEAWATQGSQT